MIVERGIDKVKAGPRTKVLIRALAAVAAVHLALIVFYNIPNSWIGIHSDEWPADLQKRSYLTNYVCGDGTDRACPGPGGAERPVRHERLRRRSYTSRRGRPGDPGGHDGAASGSLRPRETG